jgi:hypothetical protein
VSTAVTSAQDLKETGQSVATESLLKSPNQARKIVVTLRDRASIGGGRHIEQSKLSIQTDFRQTYELFNGMKPGAVKKSPIPNLCGPLNFDDIVNSCFSPLNRSEFLNDAMGNSTNRLKSAALSPHREKLEKAVALRHQVLADFVKSKLER